MEIYQVLNTRKVTVEVLLKCMQNLEKIVTNIDEYFFKQILNLKIIFLE